MKRLFALACMMTLVTSPLFATDFKKERKAASPETKPAAKPASQNTDVKRAELKKMLEAKKAELNGSEWQVEMSSGGKSLGKDTLTFQNNQITCKTLKDKGYPATNYTVSVPEGSDMAVWETMQTHPKKGVVFIRGEWKEGMMRGVISEQVEEGKNTDTQFASTAREAVAPTTEKEKTEEELKAEAAAAAAAAAPLEAAPAEKVEDAPKEDTPAAPPVAAFAPGTVDEIKA
jgi:hypothetical protein